MDLLTTEEEEEKLKFVSVRHRHSKQTQTTNHVAFDFGYVIGWHLTHNYMILYLSKI